MTLMTIISVNMLLGAGLAYSLLRLLAFGIHTDRIRHEAQVRTLRRVVPDRRAA
jgi:hypothetical protein